MNPILGVAGTAKNTGKTTALMASLDILREDGHPVFLTSIGYDGERVDNVTGLPKPKIRVEDGDQIATALPLMEASRARFLGLKFTGVVCALGPVFTGIASSPGEVVVAGPTSTRDAQKVLSYVPNNRVILLDGALSRLSPMALASHILIATGAARYSDPGSIVKEMSSIQAILDLPVYSGEPWDLYVPGTLYFEGQEDSLWEIIRTGGVQFPEAGGEGQLVTGMSKLALPQSSTRTGIRSIYIEGIVRPAFFQNLLERHLARSPHPLSFVVSHPVNLLLSGDISAWKRILDDLSSMGHRMYTRRAADFLGFTVSPYYPAFNPSRNEYVASYLPAQEFLAEIREKIPAPCTDIVLEGTGTLQSWIRNVVHYPNGSVYPA